MLSLPRFPFPLGPWLGLLMPRICARSPSIALDLQEIIRGTSLQVQDALAFSAFGGVIVIYSLVGMEEVPELVSRGR